MDDPHSRHPIVVPMRYPPGYAQDVARRMRHNEGQRAASARTRDMTRGKHAGGPAPAGAPLRGKRSARRSGAREGGTRADVNRNWPNNGQHRPRLVEGGQTLANLGLPESAKICRIWPNAGSPSNIRHLFDNFGARQACREISRAQGEELLGNLRVTMLAAIVRPQSAADMTTLARSLGDARACARGGSTRSAQHLRRVG